MSKSILALLVIASCLSALLVAVEGYDPDYPIIVWAGSTPNIDGVMTSGEWDDASTTQFDYTVVYFKQDGVNLYVAFNVSDNTLNMEGDIVMFGIDVLNDGGPQTQPDDVFFFMSRSGYKGEQNGTGDAVPPTGWIGYATSPSNYWQVEFSITYAKIQITPGVPKTLGVTLESIDGSNIYWWPPIAFIQLISPSYWGNLISGEAWIPEFPLFLIFPLFIMATLLAVIVCRNKLRKT